MCLVVAIDHISPLHYMHPGPSSRYLEFDIEREKRMTAEANARGIEAASKANADKMLYEQQQAVLQREQATLQQERALIQQERALMLQQAKLCPPEGECSHCSQPRPSVIIARLNLSSRVCPVCDAPAAEGVLAIDDQPEESAD